MYVYLELGPRVSEGSDASRKYMLELGKSPEGVWSSGVNTESSREVQNMESPYTTDLSFRVAQVFADLGSTSVEAGTHHRYPPYSSLNLVLKI